MNNHTITGGGGVKLHVLETGNAKKRPIVFFHGFSQCSHAWIRQMNSDLANTFRLIAVDLRGHGQSEKPLDGYADSRLWADDVRAVIQALDLDRPVLCGWSYGPLVILDYLRHYGEDAIGGLNFVGGVTKLGSDEAASVLTAEFLGLIPGFFCDDAEQSVRSLSDLISLCFEQTLSVEDRYHMLGYNVCVPPYVRRALLSRSFDNDDLLATLQKPVLITHGSADAVVKPTVIERQMSRVKSASIRSMATGHACFWDDAAGYNRILRDFAHSV